MLMRAVARNHQSYLLVTCAGIHGYNRVPNCRCPSSAILRPGDPDRHPVLVSSSEAVDGRSTEAGAILLQLGQPRFELAATLLAPMYWELRVDDLPDAFAGRTSRSMPEPTKSTLKKYRRQSSKMELTTTRASLLTLNLAFSRRHALYSILSLLSLPRRT